MTQTFVTTTYQATTAGNITQNSLQQYKMVLASHI